MEQLPINKIFLAGFAFVAIHWKKILKISIVPTLISLPLLISMPELIALAQQILTDTLSTPPALPNNIGLYLLLFFYGYISLSINLYRLVILDEQAVSILPIVELGKIIRFIGLSLLVGLPIIFNNPIWLPWVVYFFLIPITLNFVNIAIGNPFKYRWNLSFTTQMNLFFLQVIVPMLMVLLLTYPFSFFGLGLSMEWISRVLAFYWSSITLALCYQLIETSDT